MVKMFDSKPCGYKFELSQSDNFVSGWFVSVVFESRGVLGPTQLSLKESLIYVALRKSLILKNK